MKLWVDGSAGNAGQAVRATVKEQVAEINRKVISRGTRAVNAMRNAELRVLKGQRSGRVYKKPGTYGRASTATKALLGEYGHRLKGGQLYRASAPGEPPARRTGNLRMHWNGQVKSESSSGQGVAITAELESQESYAVHLEHGTPKIAPRPFVERIKQEAMPEIKKIYGEPYT
ncbi:MAG: hypothetical protein K2L18_03730 [Acetatifactor sp.]|nr:hypothetical protein [Acetatifactor sp.]